MAKINFKDKKLFVDHQEIPLLSGEIHYWRINPMYWEKCLARIREMGINIVASYICWDFHEYEQDRLDFKGITNPARNLSAFLELLEEKDFWIIIRPGPYIYSEWAQAGIPERFSRLHRLHPHFLTAAKSYMAQVVQVLKPHFVTRGGKIILFQADNEIDPFCHAYADQLGLYGGNSMFQQFLLEKYGSLDELNKAWGDDFKDISQAKAMMTMVLTNPHHRRRYLDFREFRQWFTNKKAQWMINNYRQLGVDIPIYLNTYPHCAVQNWRELNEIADLVGIDQYPTNEFEHLSDDHFNFYKNISYAAAVLDVPYIAEFESGIWHGWHYSTKILTTNHYRLACLTALAGGMIGWNWYMLVDRDNWYMSPINPKGEKRPELYSTFKQIVDAYQKIAPSHWRKLTDIAVTYNENHLTVETLDHNNSIMKALYDADLNFECNDLLKKNSFKRVLFYNGPQWLSKQEQQNLSQFVEDGGHLVCFQIFPYMDENLQPYNLLNFQFPEGTTLTKRVRISIDNEFIELESPLFFFSVVKGEPVKAEQIIALRSFQEESEFYNNIETGRLYTIGYQQNIGKGSVVVLGCRPTVDILVAILNKFNCIIYSHTSIQEIHTALFNRDGTYFLIVINNGDEDKAAKIWLADSIFAGKKYKCSDLFDNTREIINFGSQPFITKELSRKDGTIIRVQPL